MRTKYPIKDSLFEILKKNNTQGIFEKIDDHHCVISIKNKKQENIEMPVVGILDMLMEAYVLGQKNKLK